MAKHDTYNMNKNWIDDLSHFDYLKNLESTKENMPVGFFIKIGKLFLGLPWIDRTIPQRIPCSYEKIHFWLLESLGYTIACFTGCGIVRPSFLHWWKIYYRQTHVCSFSPCDVSQVFGSFSHVQKNRTHYHHDKRNGKTV